MFTINEQNLDLRDAKSMTAIVATPNPTSKRQGVIIIEQDTWSSDQIRT